MEIAIIDLGTRGCRLARFRDGPTGGVELLDSCKEPLDLGPQVFGTGALDADANRALLAALVRLVDRARSRSACRIVAVATTPLREARNAELVRTAIRHRTGLELEVLSGEDEARLVHLGACASGPWNDARTVVAKIGAGSLELSVGDRRDCRLAASLPLGTEALRVAHGLGDAAPDGRHLGVIYETIRGALGPYGAELRCLEPEHLVFTSGTAQAVARVADLVDHGAPRVAGTIRVSALLELPARLATPDRTLRTALAHERRSASQLSLGAALMASLQLLLGCRVAWVSEDGFHVGLALREVARTRGARRTITLPGPMSVGS